MKINNIISSVNYIIAFTNAVVAHSKNDSPSGATGVEAVALLVLLT